MKYLLILALAIIVASCTVDSNKIKELEARQIKLEQRIDSLEHVVKMMEKIGAQTDSILMEEVFRNEPGSLLYELQNQ
jgi:hypothetical protein